MHLDQILGIASFLLFFPVFHLSRDKKKMYLLYVLWLFPFISLNITNETFGTISVFDGISYYVFIILMYDFVFRSKHQLIYYCLFVGFTITLIIGSVRSEFVLISLIHTLKFLSFFIYAKVLLDEFNKDPAFMERLLWHFKWICGIAVIFIIFQLLFGLKFTFYRELNQNTVDQDGTRYPSFFYDTQVCAQFLAMCSFLFFINKKPFKFKQAFLNWTFLSLTVLGLFLTGGRAGLIGFCAGLVILFLFQSYRIKMLLLVTVVAAYFAVSNFAGSLAVFNRDQDADQSYQVRTRIWTEAYKVFKSNPVFGVGMDNYWYYNLKHTFNGYYIFDNQVVSYGTENGYLKILVECGLSGLVFFALLIAVPVITATGNFIKYKLHLYTPYILAMIAAWMFSFITSNTFDDKRIIVLLTSLICVLIVQQKDTSKKFKSNDPKQVRHI